MLQDFLQPVYMKHKIKRPTDAVLTNATRLSTKPVYMKHKIKRPTDAVLTNATRLSTKPVYMKHKIKRPTDAVLTNATRLSTNMKPQEANRRSLIMKHKTCLYEARSRPTDAVLTNATRLSTKPVYMKHRSRGQQMQC